MNFKLSHQEISSAYSKHILNLLNNSSEHTPYFVTTKLKYIPIDDALSRQIKYPLLSNEIWKCYSRFYRHLISRLAKNWQTKRYIYPLTFDFLDIDHTRHTKTVTFTHSTKPHIHSVYLVHNDALLKFLSLRDERCASILMHPSIEPMIESVCIEPVTKLNRLVSYSVKFAENYQLQREAENVELVFQQPIALFETTREQHKALLKKHPEQRYSLNSRFAEQRIKRMLKNSRNAMIQRFSKLHISRQRINTSVHSI